MPTGTATNGRVVEFFRPMFLANDNIPCLYSSPGPTVSHSTPAIGTLQFDSGYLYSYFVYTGGGTPRSTSFTYTVTCDGLVSNTVTVTINIPT